MIKTPIAAAIVAAFLLSPVAPFATSSALAVTCDDTVPEAWKRTGGYCEQMSGGGANGGSMITPTTQPCPPAPQVSMLPKGFFKQKGMRVLVAYMAYDEKGCPIYN